MSDKPFLRVGNYNWTIDVDRMSEYVTIPDKEEVTIDVTKYEFMKMMTEIVMSLKEDDFDQVMGLSKVEDIPFKIAFNTLLDKDIIVPK